MKNQKEPHKAKFNLLLHRLFALTLACIITFNAAAPAYAQALLQQATDQAHVTPWAYNNRLNNLEATLQRRATPKNNLADLCKRIPFCTPNPQDLSGDALLYIVPGEQYKTEVETLFRQNPQHFDLAITDPAQGPEALAKILSQIRAEFAASFHTTSAQATKQREIVISQLLPALLPYNDEAIKAFALEAATKEISAFNAKFSTLESIAKADIAHLPQAVNLYGMVAPQGDEHHELTTLIGKTALTPHAPALLLPYAGALIAMDEWVMLTTFIKAAGAYELGGAKTRAGQLFAALGEMLSAQMIVGQNKILRDKYAGGPVSAAGFYTLEATSDPAQATLHNVWEDLPRLMVEAGGERGAQVVQDIFNHGLTFRLDSQAIGVPLAQWEHGVIMPFIIGAIDSGAVGGGSVPHNMTPIARYFGANKTGLVELNLLSQAMLDLNNPTYRRVRAILRAPYMAQIEATLNDKPFPYGRENFNVLKSVNTDSAFFASDPVFNGMIYNRNAEVNGVKKPSGIILNHSDTSRLAAQAKWAQITKATTMVDLGISVYFMANLGKLALSLGTSAVRVAKQQVALMRLVRATGMPATEWAVQVTNLRAAGMRPQTIAGRLGNAAAKAQGRAQVNPTGNNHAIAKVAEAKVDLAQAVFKLQETRPSAPSFAQKVSNYNSANKAMTEANAYYAHRYNPLESLERSLANLSSQGPRGPSMSDIANMTPRPVKTGPSLGARASGFIHQRFGRVAGSFADAFRLLTNKATVGTAALLLNYGVATATPAATLGALRAPAQIELVASSASRLSGAVNAPRAVFSAAPRTAQTFGGAVTRFPAQNIPKPVDLVDPRLFQMGAAVGSLSLKPVAALGLNALAATGRWTLAGLNRLSTALTAPAPAPAMVAAPVRTVAQTQSRFMEGFGGPGVLNSTLLPLPQILNALRNLFARAQAPTQVTPLEEEPPAPPLKKARASTFFWNFAVGVSIASLTPALQGAFDLAMSDANMIINFLAYAPAAATFFFPTAFKKWGTLPVFRAASIIATLGAVLAVVSGLNGFSPATHPLALPGAMLGIGLISLGTEIRLAASYPLMESTFGETKAIAVNTNAMMGRAAGSAAMLLAMPAFNWLANNLGLPLAQNGGIGLSAVLLPLAIMTALSTVKAPLVNAPPENVSSIRKLGELLRDNNFLRNAAIGFILLEVFDATIQNQFFNMADIAIAANTLSADVSGLVASLIPVFMAVGRLILGELQNRGITGPKATYALSGAIAALGTAVFIAGGISPLGIAGLCLAMAGISVFSSPLLNATKNHGNVSAADTTITLFGVSTLAGFSGLIQNYVTDLFGMGMGYAVPAAALALAFFLTKFVFKKSPQPAKPVEEMGEEPQSDPKDITM